VIDKPIEPKRGVELGSSLSYCPIQSCGDSVRVDVWKQFGTSMCDSLKDSYVAMDIDQLVYNPVYGVITKQVDNAIQSKIKGYEYR
jgi:hypothetical protein